MPAARSRHVPRDCLGGKRAVQQHGRDAVLPRRVHLVFHEGDEGTHHQREPVPQQGGKLVAEGLSPAGGERGKHVAAFQNLPEDLFLVGPERGEAEVAS